VSRTRGSAPGRVGEGMLVVAALGLLVTSLVQVSEGWSAPVAALAFGVFIALGELLRITLPDNRDAAPLGAAAALAYALVPQLWGEAMNTSTWQVVTVTAVGILVGAFPHAVAGRRLQVDAMARRLLTVAFASALFRFPPLQEHLVADAPERWVTALTLVWIAAATGVVDAVLAAAVTAGNGWTPYRAALRDELWATVGISSAIGATGVLVALAATVMDLWALPVFAVPLLLTQFAFRRYAAIRATYLQTVRALSKVTEVAGYTEAGHARRVSELAVAVGRDLGVGERDLRRLEYAALMHDLGQLSLTDPVPGGATVVVAPAEARRLAGLGADIIRTAGVLDDVATVVERQAEPYRRRFEGRAGSVAEVPLASRVIRAANAYDDLVGDSLERRRRLEALERLRLGTAYDYDPRVVESLARVTERPGLA
jgi:HD domain